jgi:hypothetical protein
MKTSQLVVISALTAQASAASNLHHLLGAHKLAFYDGLKAQKAAQARELVDCSGEGTTWGPDIAPPPDGCDTGGAPDDNGLDEGTGVACTAPPCPGGDLGDVGFVTVSGTDDRSGGTFAPGENIYGPFEAGFSATQDNILATLGCTSGFGYVDGGIDTNLAERIVAHDCSVVLPRVEGDEYVSLLDECGGHTEEYVHHRTTKK